MLVVCLAVALALPRQVAAAESDSPVAEAIDKTTGVSTYRSEVTITVIGAPESWFEGYPGVDPTQEIPFVDYTASYGENGAHFVLGGLGSALLTGPRGTTDRVPVTGASAPSSPASAAPQTPAVSGSPTARVYNGGNVRKAPNLNGQVLDQIHAGEAVTLLERTQSSEWFYIINPRGVGGWVHRSLLTLDRATIEQVPALPG